MNGRQFAVDPSDPNLEIRSCSLFVPYEEIPPNIHTVRASVGRTALHAARRERVPGARVPGG